MAYEQLQEVLLRKVGFEVVTHSAKDNQVRFFGRVRPPQVSAWLETMTQLLMHADDAAWSLDLSRQYFVRGGKLLYGWRVIIQGEKVAQYLPQVIGVIQNAKTVVRELDEIPLHANPNRNALRNGRGAQLTEKAVVGPMAKAQLGM